MTAHNERAVVLVSGGLDSATVLAMATGQGYQCYALSIDYGQRHRLELDRARQVARTGGAVDHRVIKIDLAAFGGSALTDQAIEVPTTESNDIPITYVPARNTVFLSIALGWAEVLQARAIFIGANAVDYSGYPDCRPEYIEAFQQLANLATKAGIEGDVITVQAPLINMTKAEIISTGVRLGVDFGLTISCYNPEANGRVCGVCDSCRIRAAGFSDAGIEDPAIVS
ncbi:MAG: 7-cyano-7-deazaguanine synthase QueC [Arenicella sp.]|nr:7-cyano-7-deazaguanine synthase QueC [Arenicella sp.]